MSEIVVRRARLGDVAEMGAVIRAAYAEFDGVIADLPDASAGLEEEVRDHLVWVAETDGVLAGVLVLHVKGEVAHLVNVAVATAGRGMGLGQRLIEGAVEAARRAGAAVVNLATHKDMPGNVALYERLGWTVAERAGNKVVMSRRLEA